MPRLLDDNTIAEIHKYIRDIHENIGISFGTEKALDLFKKHGAKVEGDRVFISNELLEKALSTLPKYDYTDLTPQRITATSPFGNVPIIYNNESKKYQKGTIDDVIKMYQLTQTSDLYECANPSVVEPEGNDTEDQYIGQIAMLLKYSDKWISNGMRATAGNSKNGDIYQSMRGAFQLVKKFHDKWDEPIMGQGLCPMSPLAYDYECLENLDATIDEKQNIVICPCTLTNLTGPPSLLGLAIHDLALSFAGIVYAQLLSPGIDVSLSPCSASTDMRSVQPAYGTTETVYIATIFYEFCKELKIGCSMVGSLADSAKVDYQAGVESLLTTMLPYYITDIDTVWCYPGHMSAWYCGSFEKLILDEEMMRNVNRSLQGVNLKVDSKYMQNLKTAQAKNTFLSGRTPKNYRDEHYLSEIFSKYGVSDDMSPEKTDVNLIVKNELANRIERYQLPDLTNAQKKILQPYLPSKCKY